MQLADLVFIAVTLAALVTLGAAAMALAGRRWGRALLILRRLGLCAVAYLATVAVAGRLAPQRVLAVGEPWCFDDWCLTVEQVARTPAPPANAWTVSLRLSSQARRISQRAKNAWIFLVDRNGRRYSPRPDPSATPLDVLLGPGESVLTSRTFLVPAGARELGLITGHGGPGGFPGVIIIGDESSLFHKPTFVRLP